MPVKRYAIIRIKTSKYAWQWAVHLRRSGTFYSKFFSDNKYGGEKQSLAAAIAWRDKTAAQNVLTFREFYEQKRSNNTSGVPGVHMVMLVAQPEGSWQAKILLPDGRKLTKSFAIKKFGGKEAFKRAVAAQGDDRFAGRTPLFEKQYREEACSTLMNDSRPRRLGGDPLPPTFSFVSLCFSK